MFQNFLDKKHSPESALQTMPLRIKTATNLTDLLNYRFQIYYNICYQVPHSTLIILPSSEMYCIVLEVISNF
jgi:hypothetical protein